MPVYFASTVYNSSRKEIQRLVNLANKRVERLRNNELTMTSAYRQYFNYRYGQKFSVKGKTKQELYAEVMRLTKFLNDSTSTVRGAISEARKMMIGAKKAKVAVVKNFIDRYGELIENAKHIFKKTEEAGNAINYAKLKKVVDQYIKENYDTFTQSEDYLEKALDYIESALSIEKPLLKGLEGYGTVEGDYEWL